MNDSKLSSHNLSAKQAVFLDRDGTINAMVYNKEFGLVDSPLNPDQFHLLPDVGKAVHLINEMGFLAVVVSNQPGIAKSKFTPEVLNAVTLKMKMELAKSGTHLDGIYYCLHHPDAVVDGFRIVCECRKPKPGLLLQASRDLGIDLSRSYIIGDGLTDIQAGEAVGCTTLWIGRLKCDVCQAMGEKRVSPHFIASNLLEAVRLIQRKELGDGDLLGYLRPCADRKMATAGGHRRSNH